MRRNVLVSPSAADVSIEGRAEPLAKSPGRFRLVVAGSRRDGSSIGERELVSTESDCRALDDSLVLVIALMIDPNAELQAPPAKESGPPPPAEPHVVVHERVVVHEIREREVSTPSAPWLVDGALSGVLGIQRMPGTSPGLAVGVRLGPSRASAFELSLGALPSTSLEVGGRSVDYSLIEGGLAYCPSLSLARRFELGGCVGARLGNVHVRGHGFAPDAESDRPLVDLALGARALVFAFDSFFLSATASALAPLVRQRTTVAVATRAPQVLDDRSPVGAEVALGIGLRFSP